MPCQPLAHLRMLVGCVVVDDGVDRLLDRYLCLDGIEEADELLVPVALHVAADDGTVEDVESSEQRGRTVAFVVVGAHGASQLFPLASSLPWIAKGGTLNRPAEALVAIPDPGRHYSVPVGGIISLWWAASFRYSGRHHLVMMGGLSRNQHPCRFTTPPRFARGFVGAALYRTL